MFELLVIKIPAWMFLAMVIFAILGGGFFLVDIYEGFSHTEKLSLPYCKGAFAIKLITAAVLCNTISFIGGLIRLLRTKRLALWWPFSGILFVLSLYLVWMVLNL